MCIMYLTCTLNLSEFWDKKNCAACMKRYNILFSKAIGTYLD